MCERLFAISRTCAHTKTTQKHAHTHTTHIYTHAQIQHLSAGGFALSSSPLTNSDPLSARLCFLDQILSLLDTHLAVARKSILLAAKSLPVHGVLRALHQVPREVDFSAVVAQGGGACCFLAFFFLSYLSFSCLCFFPFLCFCGGYFAHSTMCCAISFSLSPVLSYSFLFSFPFRARRGERGGGGGPSIRVFM